MRRYLPGLFILLAFGASALVYGRLPDRMPSHWNAAGQVDAYASRFLGAFLLPAMALVMWGVFRLLPKIDPRRQNYAKFQGMYDALVASVIGLMCLMHLGILAFSLGWPVPVDRLIVGGVAVLFMVLGNMLPRARPNWFVGLRTPWTLSSDRVWERTHRVGGYAFILAGLVLLGTLIVAPTFIMQVTVGTAFGITAFVLGYSYYAWRQERG